MRHACPDNASPEPDHVLILDLGPADKVDPRVESLGKSFTPVTRAAVVV